MSASDERPRAVVVIGSGTMTIIPHHLMAALARYVDGIAVQDPQRYEPVRYRDLALTLPVPSLFKVPPTNNIKQLRREQRSREQRTRKMLPKGKGRR